MDVFNYERDFAFEFVEYPIQIPPLPLSCYEYFNYV